MADTDSRYGWIDILTPDGPFITAAALDPTTVGEGWPTRLNPAQRAILAGSGSQQQDDGTWDTRRSRVEKILIDLLGYRPGKTLSTHPDVTATHHVYRARVPADFIIHAPNDPDDVRMVVICGPAATPNPDRLEANRSTEFYGWVSTPVQRAALLARHVRADLALVTSGQEHLLVNVVTGTTGSATWSTNALEDRVVQDAFVALLHKERVLHGVLSTAHLIELSQDRQQELTDTLGRQVRQAAEALVNAISRANRATRGELLRDVSGQEVYAATTRVLMRIVFLLVAEERGLLPLAENQLYAEQYAVTTLLDRLEDDHYRNRSAMQRRSGAWQRLLALSRAVHAGVDHDELRLPAYGGALFDPDEHPFLEGRTPTAASDEGDGALHQHPDVGVVDDHTVLTVLRQIQVAHGQRISFRSLDVEQIGHVYESLLDHSAVIVSEEQGAVLGLQSRRGEEPEISLADLEEWRARSDIEPGERLVRAQVAAESSAFNVLDRGLDPESDVAKTLNIACGNDDLLLRRIEPFAPLLRTDARGVALVFLPGDVYVTETSSKRDTGTAYTPRSLAEEVAKHAIDPLIYEPGPHNEPDESKWTLRFPDEILDLKVCDPAVGSAAILVAAARYLAEALLQSRIQYGELLPNALSSAATDVDALDVRIDARREVVSKCVYGVDRDPMAAEMAKLSLWLTTMAKNRPFTFLDHAIKVGDSLLGMTGLDQLRHLHLDPSRVMGGAGHALQFGAEEWWVSVEETLTEVEAIREKLRRIEVLDVADANAKAELNRAAEGAGQKLRLVADAVTAACLGTATEKEATADARLESLGPLVAKLDHPDAQARLRDVAQSWRERGNPNDALPRRFLHWPLAFPEVFHNGAGFDCVLGNPPFLGGTKISDPMGTDYYRHIQRYIARARTSRADLSAFFFRRAAIVSRGTIGFLATNTIKEADTQEHGLRPLISDWSIYRAVRTRVWPGSQNLHVSQVWLRRGDWEAPRSVVGDSLISVRYISSALTGRHSSDTSPYTLDGQTSLYFNGYKLDAKGFVLTQAEAATLATEDGVSGEVIFPIANGKEALEGSWDRMVIDFGTMTETEARQFPAAWRHVEVWVRDEVMRKSSSYETWRDRWWQFWRPREELRKRIEELHRVIVVPTTSKHGVPLLGPPEVRYTHAVMIIPDEDLGLFGLLHSEPHWWWVIERSSKLKSDIRYSASDCLATFPFPRIDDAIRNAGHELAEAREALADAEGGVTEALNRVHDERDDAETVQRVRRALERLNAAVIDAYGWPDSWARLEFIDVEQRGVRFTLPEATVNRVLDALTELNIRQYAESRHVPFATALNQARI